MPPGIRRALPGHFVTWRCANAFGVCGSYAEYSRRLLFRKTLSLVECDVASMLFADDVVAGNFGGNVEAIDDSHPGGLVVVDEDCARSSVG